MTIQYVPPRLVSYDCSIVVTNLGIIFSVWIIIDFYRRDKQINLPSCFNFKQILAVDSQEYGCGSVQVIYGSGKLPFC